MTADALFARNCIAVQGGGGFVSGELTAQKSASIEHCTVGGDGAGLYLGSKAKVNVQVLGTMHCRATSGAGGGVYGVEEATFDIDTWNSVCNSASMGDDAYWLSTTALLIVRLNLYVDESRAGAPLPFAGKPANVRVLNGTVYTNKLTQSQISSDVTLRKMLVEPSRGCPATFGQPTACGYTTCTEEPQDSCKNTAVCRWTGSTCHVEDPSKNVPMYSITNGIFEAASNTETNYWFSDGVEATDSRIADEICKLLCSNGRNGRLARMLSVTDMQRMAQLRQVSSRPLVTALLDGSDVDTEGTWQWSDGITFWTVAAECYQLDCPWDAAAAAGGDYLYLTNENKWTSKPETASSPFFCEFACTTDNDCNENGDTCPYQCNLHGRCELSGECCGNVQDEATCKGHHPHCEWVAAVDTKAAYCTQAVEVCKVFYDIDEICTLFLTDTCAIWAGNGSSVQSLPQTCSATHDFSLTCNDAADAIACPGGFCLSISPGSVGQNLTVTVASCQLSGQIGIKAEEGISTRQLVLEDTMIRGVLDLDLIPNVLLDNVTVVNSEEAAPAFSLTNVQQARATTLKIRCDKPKIEAANGGGMYLSASRLDADAIEIADYVARAFPRMPDDVWSAEGVWIYDVQRRIFRHVRINSCL
ncbi:hypothetical protein DIPPA_33106 [Diplonema papillatum]|nr:hypothetical protein DIPPA_33106 [Diplonema papillatum]